MVNQKTARSEFLTKEALDQLKAYKYSSVDKSPISNYILRHYWNAFVELLPLWLAPNMVTILGFCFILFNIALVVIFIPDLTGPRPDWLPYSFAFGLWMYSTMDNVDDSLNCTLGSLLEAAAMGLGPTKTGAFTALIPCLPMYFSTWETYHTHTLYLGYINGPTEGLILACSVMLVSGYYGPQIWEYEVSSKIDLPSQLAFLEGYKFRDVWIFVVLFAFFGAHFPGCVMNVVEARRSRNQPIAPVFLNLIPIVIYTAATCAWLGSPYSTLLQDNHLVLYCLTQSFVFGRLTTKIILAHLTRQPFPYWTVLLAPLVGGAIMTNLPRLGFEPISAQGQLIYLWSYFVFSAIVYFRWAMLVIDAICTHLNINCLTIPDAKVQQLLRQQKSS